MYTFCGLLQELKPKEAKNRPKEAAFRMLVGIFEKIFGIRHT